MQEPEISKLIILILLSITIIYIQFDLRRLNKKTEELDRELITVEEDIDDLNKDLESFAQSKEFHSELERLITEGLTIDGVHHKQWYLEQIAKLLEVNLNNIEGQYEKGIHP